MQERDILLIAKISDALAHPARIKIFRYIMTSNKKRERVCNKDLVNYFDYSQATISQHVKKLRDAGLVEVRKEDRYSYYYVHLGTLNDEKGCALMVTFDRSGQQPFFLSFCISLFLENNEQYRTYEKQELIEQERDYTQR